MNDELDDDGGGSLEFKELQKILRSAPPAKKKMQDMLKKTAAVAKLAGK